MAVAEGEVDAGGSAGLSPRWMPSPEPVNVCQARPR